MALIKRRFRLHEIVFAKIKGYAPWPAFIEKINGNEIEVVFNSKRMERY